MKTLKETQDFIFKELTRPEEESIILFKLKNNLGLEDYDIAECEEEEIKSIQSAAFKCSILNKYFRLTNKKTGNNKYLCIEPSGEIEISDSLLSFREYTR
jgi:hypothetical protein